MYYYRIKIYERANEHPSLRIASFGERTDVTSSPSVDIVLGLNGTSSKGGDYFFFPFY
jgi:hypothetical protein